MEKLLIVIRTIIKELKFSNILRSCTIHKVIKILQKSDRSVMYFSLYSLCFSTTKWHRNQYMEVIRFWIPPTLYPTNHLVMDIYKEILSSRTFWPTGSFLLYFILDIYLIWDDHSCTSPWLLMFNHLCILIL